MITQVMAAMITSETPIAATVPVINGDYAGCFPWPSGQCDTTCLSLEAGCWRTSFAGRVVRQHVLRPLPTTTEWLALAGLALEWVVAAECAVAYEKGRRQDLK